MATDDIIWKIEPHTKAKHEILRYYLGAWFPILALAHPRIVYVDGFAGPGEYQGGEPGSPIIALDVAKNHILRSKFNNELVFYFIDIRKDRINNLKKIINSLQVPDNFRIEIECGSFENCIDRVLSEISSRGRTLAPSFFFIDPFGPTGFSMSLMKRIADQPRSEVLINFNYQPLNQWFLQDVSKHDNVDILFGNNSWRKALSLQVTKDKENYLRSTYQTALEALGWKIRPFCMINKYNQTQYYLFFATRNPLGMLAMKRAMWKAAPTGDFRYSDLSNPAQPCMLEQAFEEQYSSQLAHEIYKNYRGQQIKKKTLLNDFISWHPICIERHCTRALKTLEEESSPPLITNVTERKKKGAYPDNCSITFAP
jgi:three-Cys-motif partner protein